MAKKYIDADRLIRRLENRTYRAKWKFIEMINEQPAADVEPVRRWIPCSERMPEDTNPVNITWVNHHPQSYYEHIKDKPFTATGCYHNKHWYWFSCVCQDWLDEYGDCEMDKIDDTIEVIAWMPLPEPYKEGEQNE